jgi:hypothetical protein
MMVNQPVTYSDHCCIADKVGMPYMMWHRRFQQPAFSKATFTALAGGRLRCQLCCCTLPPSLQPQRPVPCGALLPHGVGRCARLH